MAPVPTEEIYPNSPLQSVVFEIRFPGEPAVECHRDEFFALVREVFPQVLVPKLREGDAAPLAPYHFRSEDNSAALMTALNLFAYRTNVYAGFEAFRKDVLRWLIPFARMFRIGKLNRTGLRYTNVIPYAPGSGFPLEHFLKLQMSLGGERVTRYDQFFMTSRIPSADGALTLQVGATEIEGGEAIVLDFDHAREAELHVDDIERHLDESHSETKKLFESLLTDEYREFMRGRELK